MNDAATPSDRLETALAARAGLGPALLRLGLGAIFLAHAYAKVALFTMPGTAKFFETHGLPGWAAYPVFFAELVGGAALLLGYRVRLAALALIPIMLGALKPHLPNGWMFTNGGGGWEYVAFIIVALAAQALLGPGAFAAFEGQAHRARGPKPATAQ